MFYSRSYLSWPYQRLTSSAKCQAWELDRHAIDTATSSFRARPVRSMSLRRQDALGVLADPTTFFCDFAIATVHVHAYPPLKEARRRGGGGDDNDSDYGGLTKAILWLHLLAATTIYGQQHRIESIMRRTTMMASHAGRFGCKESEKIRYIDVLMALIWIRIWIYGFIILLAY